MSDRLPGFGPAVISCLALLLSPMLAPGPALSQQAPAADFFETVDVNIVNVEVFVTDKKGEPVTGLTADDFEVFEDGQPVEITNFYAAERGASRGAPPPDVPPPADAVAAPPARPGAAAAPTPEDQRLHLVIFIDNLNIRPTSRNRVLEALRGSLFFNLKPDDRVMLVSYNGSSLEVHHPLTNDPQDLIAGIEKLTETAPRGAHNQLDRIAILRALQQTDLEDAVPPTPGPGFGPDSDVDWEGLLMNIKTYAERQHRLVARTVDTLGSFVDSLSALGGRKALLYVSDGLDLRPGEALYHAWDAKRSAEGAQVMGFTSVDSEARETDASPLFEELGKRANANGVTFYTILASGGLNATLTPAERGAFFDLGSPTDLGQVWNDRLEAMEASNYRGSMQILAEATGGVATTNTTAIGSALQRLQRDFETYYSLGYVAPHDGDTKDHKIKVRVKDKSLKVRHREGYRNKTSDERMSDRVRSALFFDAGDNPLGVAIDIGEESKDEKGRFLVPIMVKFPIAKLLLLPQEHFHEGQVSIFVGARDSNGGTSPIQKMPAPIRIPNDKLLTALGQVAGFRVTLMMNPGEHSVVVGVRDELADVESTARTRHTPG